jgi:hypothetical protein
MTPEILCFLTSGLCALLILGIEGYHILNIKHFRGTFIPLLEDVAIKVCDKILPDEDMDPTDMV